MEHDARRQNERKEELRDFIRRIRELEEDIDRRSKQEKKLQQELGERYSDDADFDELLQEGEYLLEEATELESEFANESHNTVDEDE